MNNQPNQPDDDQRERAVKQLIIDAHKMRSQYPPGVPVDNLGFGVRFGFDAGAASTSNPWVEINRATLGKSLQWLLMRDKHGVEGIRLGLQEDGGWLVVNEFGVSQWLPSTVDVIAVMPLSVPKDTVFHPSQQSNGTAEEKT